MNETRDVVREVRQQTEEIDIGIVNLNEDMEVERKEAAAENRQLDKEIVSASACEYMLAWKTEQTQIKYFHVYTRKMKTLFQIPFHTLVINVTYSPALRHGNCPRFLTFWP